MDNLRRRITAWLSPAEVEDRAAFERELAFVNLLRLRIIALSLLVSIPIMVYLDVVRFPAGLRALSPWAYYSSLRWVWIGGSLAYLFAAGRASGPAEIGPGRRLAVKAYVVFILFAAAIHSSLLQSSLPVIFAYLAGVVLTAAFIRLNAVESGLTMAAALGILIAGVWRFQPDHSIALTQILNGVFITAMAFVVARINYLGAVHDFNNRRLIERQKEELERLSTVDGLTEIPNRRLFDVALDREWRRAARHGRPVAIVMIDIDRFKAFNDAYGHQAGDDCLRAVAKALTRTVSREGDVVARYGGEEFAAILPDTDLNGALAVAERMRLAVVDLGLEHVDGVEKVVTVSLGAASCVPTPDSSSDSLVAAADAALYRAKEAGRNRSMAAD